MTDSQAIKGLADGQVPSMALATMGRERNTIQALHYGGIAMPALTTLRLLFAVRQRRLLAAYGL